MAAWTVCCVLLQVQFDSRRLDLLQGRLQLHKRLCCIQAVRGGHRKTATQLRVHKTGHSGQEVFHTLYDTVHIRTQLGLTLKKNTKYSNKFCILHNTLKDI